jgi:hypothetical protein
VLLPVIGVDVLGGLDVEDRSRPPIGVAVGHAALVGADDPARLEVEVRG